jgi:hypothetical protein
MNENADKDLDNLSRKVIGKSAIESPSFDFTKTVMSQINALSSSSVTTYVPLISKQVWTLIELAFVGVFGVVSSGASEEKSGWISKLNLEYEFANPLAHIELSQTVIYSVVLCAVMICIQIPLLKHYCDKRFEA